MGTVGHTHARLTIPKWAAKHPALVERCRGDMEFRMRVLSARPRERAALVEEASVPPSTKTPP